MYAVFIFYASDSSCSFSARLIALKLSSFYPSLFTITCKSPFNFYSSREYGDSEPK